jgi:hypothetical protein
MSDNACLHQRARKRARIRGMLLLRQLLRLFLAALITLAICAAQAEHQRGGVRGRVVDKYEHAPIGNVFVLVHSRHEGDRDVRTDRAGIYEVQLPPGIYDVFVSAEGFSPACRKIEVNAHKMTKFDVILEANTLGMQAD